MVSVGLICWKRSRGEHSAAPASADRDGAADNTVAHTIALDRRSAGDGNGDAASAHFRVPGRANHSRAAWESLRGGDGAGD